MCQNNPLRLIGLSCCDFVFAGVMGAIVVVKKETHQSKPAQCPFAGQVGENSSKLPNFLEDERVTHHHIFFRDIWYCSFISGSYDSLE